MMKSIKGSLVGYAPYAMGMILAVALKYHYSVAGSGGLQWVLSPTSRVVQLLTGISFEMEEYIGFVSRQHGIIIAPSCAGVNFMIIAFSTIYFTTVRLMPNGTWRVLWLGITFGIAYFLTLGVNGLRIATAISLYRADIYGGWLTPERVHRMGGTLIYFSSLLIASFFVNRVARFLLSRGQGLGWPVLAPFLGYCLIALGIPLLNKAPVWGGLRFVEHATLVLTVCAGVLLFFVFLSLLWHRAAVRIRGRRRDDSHREVVVECTPPQYPERMRRSA